MSQIVRIFRGIPGSGKTTEALAWVQKNPRFHARVNRDSIRYATFGSYVLPNQLEPLVTKIQLEIFETLIVEGKSVVVDDTNLRLKAVKPFVEIAERYNIPVMFTDFDVELKVALERNRNRERIVPDEVIRKMFKSFIHRDKNPMVALADAAYVEQYVPDTSLPKAVLVDVDGTLMNMSLERSPFEWDKVLLDEPNLAVVETVQALKAFGYTIVVMSGRDAVCRADTLLSLTEAGVAVDALFMRPEKDMRPDWQVKMELFDNNVRNSYNVVFALDDRNQVVDFYRKKLGLPVHQVNYGNF